MESFDAGYIGNELQFIGSRVKKPVSIYLIGGCAMAFRGLKEVTKDIDIVFRDKGDCEAFCDALFGAQYFEPIVITSEHKGLETIKIYENKDKFHLDLFVKRVCGKMVLSERMVKRAELYKKYGNSGVYLLAKEDVFLFKSLASEARKRDLGDMRVIYPNLDWGVIKEELSSQELSRNLIALVVRRLEEFRSVYDLGVPILNALKKMAGD
ncbi:hypothetical protein COS70_03350 [Candidatus Micrarchaeota archaeon CG06_land_8_20_14_3_00_50_6]|nr:MAG: hypothetical protein COS70_03350 [Candidatus Micrarchaeota archaeon CG06_land_8_20_14_3_00_50_6]